MEKHSINNNTANDGNMLLSPVVLEAIQNDAQIKALQDQIKALDDESADNEKKLAKLKAERNLWLKDDSAKICTVHTEMCVGHRLNCR